MSTANEDINDADDLRRAVEDKLQDNGHAASVCRFLGLAVRGNAAQKRARILQYIAGNFIGSFLAL